MKCFAPCAAASWRGRPIEISEDGSCELEPQALAEMRAHGFSEWRDEDAKPPRAKPARKGMRSDGGE